MGKTISKVRKNLLLISLLLLILTCDSDKEFYFPYVSFDMQLGLHTDLVDLGNLNAKIFKGYGVGGVLIFKASDTEFYAFDMACTYDVASEICPIEEYNNNIIVWECPCCKSQYTLNISGVAYVSKGPAEHSLKRYSTSFDGVYLWVSN